MNSSIPLLYNQSYFSIETINFEEKCLLDKHFFLIINSYLKKEDVLNILHRLYKERDLLINDILNSKISKEDYLLICRNGIKENEKNLSKMRLNKVVDEKGVEEEYDNINYDNRSNNSNNSYNRNIVNKRKDLSLYHFRSCNRNNSIDNKESIESINYEEKAVNGNRKFKSFHDINNEYKNIGKSIKTNDSQCQKQKKVSKNKSSFNFFSLENNIQNHIQNRISIFKDEIRNINNNHYFRSKDFLYTEESERRFFPVEYIKKLDYLDNIIYFDIEEVEKALKEQPKGEYFQYKLRLLKVILLKKEKMNENPYASQRVPIKEAEGMISLYKILNSYIDLEINPIYENLRNTLKGRILYIITNLTLYINDSDIKDENNNQITSSTIFQITKATKDKRQSILNKERDSYIKDKMLSYLKNKYFQFKSAMSYSEKNEYTFNKASIETINFNISILNNLIEEYEQTGNIKNINDVPQNFTPQLVNFEDMTKREIFFDELIKNYEKMRYFEVELYCLLNETDQFDVGNEEFMNNDNNENIYDNNKEVSFNSNDSIMNTKSKEKNLGNIEKVRTFHKTISDEKAIFKQKLKVYSNIINILKKSKENLYTPLPKYETEYLNIIEEIENNSLSERQIQITFSQPIPGLECKYYIQSFSPNSISMSKSMINSLFITMTKNKNPSSIYTYDFIYNMDEKQYKSFIDTNQIRIEVYVPYKISLIKCGFNLKYYFHINTSDFSIKSTIIKENILFDIKTNHPSQYYTVTTLQIKRALYRKEIQIVSKPFYNIIKYYPTFESSNYLDDDKPKLTEKEIFTLEIEKNFFFSKEQGLHNVNLKEKLIEMRRKYDKEEEDEVINGNIINLNNSRLRLNDVHLEENLDVNNKKNIKKIKFKNSNNNLNILNSNENINQNNKKTSIFKFYTIKIPNDDSVLHSNTKIKSNKNIKAITKSFSSPQKQQNQQQKVKIYNINSLSSKELSSPLDIDYYCSIRTLEMRLSNLESEYKKQDYIVDSEKNHINQLKNKLDNINKKLNIGELTLKDYIQILRIRLDRDKLLLINYYNKPNSEILIKEISERINTLKMEIEECGA